MGLVDESRHLSSHRRTRTSHTHPHIRRGQLMSVFTVCLDLPLPQMVTSWSVAFFFKVLTFFWDWFFLLWVVAEG